MLRSLTFPDAIVASDAMPVLGASSDDAWPVVDGSTHPRTAGCFSRALRLWRTEGYPLLDAVRRCTLLPSRVLAPLHNKGKLQPGADADIVVFDADRITDQATYLESTRPSIGMQHVIVNGEFVVRDGALLLDARPGRAVRA